MWKRRWSLRTLFGAVALLLVLAAPLSAQPSERDTTSAKSMAELIAAQKFIVLQVLSDDGDVAVHLFGDEMKEAAEEEFERLEKEIRDDETQARLDFGIKKEKKVANIWGVVTEAASQLQVRRGDLRLVKVTRRGADFIGYEIPGQDETWLPIRKIALVRRHRGE